VNRIPLTVPNILTLFRFALVPVCAIFIYFDKMILALVIYIVACSTDLLDGYIARKHHLVTEAGILLDPLADKLMSVFAVISFTVSGALGDMGWYILIALFVKELLMIGGGIFLYFRDIISPANTFGKIAAFIFNTSVAFAFLHKFVNPWHVWFMCFALVFTLASLGQYAYLNMYKKLKQKPSTAKTQNVKS
jgi:cardiolipin synthase